LYSCRFLNFSVSRSEMDLAARSAIREIEGDAHDRVSPDYADSDSEKYAAMVDAIRRNLNLTSLRYQRLPDMIEAIGLPKEKVCTYCWDGKQ
ncbi:MAG TPA: amidophosphoribosyltransferase, partial [Thermodesulfobacteriota bacterium]|nr:amidophosphoribosyltransferase [Thermodesulfobacteriota bacterium]